MNLAEELKSVVKGEVMSDAESLKTYSRDASLFEIAPAVVVAPKDSGDVRSLVRFVNEHKEQKLSLTARSGATDMTGGPLSESIVLDLAKHFTHIASVGDGKAVVEPGVFYRDFERETLKHGLLLPSYPASREICTVGGMVANNAGGEKSLTYGKTEQYVQRLKVVLADGNEYDIGPLSAGQLEEQKKQNTFLGEAYRKLHGLVESHYDALQAARPKVSKNSAGYYLWNVWDRKTFDLTKLFTGSQGTLGVITDITFRLVKPKQHSVLLVIFMKDLSALPGVVDTVLRHRPESFESFDDKTLLLTLRFLPAFVKLLKTNLLKLAWQFLPEFGMVLSGGVPRLVLLAEFTGDSAGEVLRKAHQARAALAHFDLRMRVTETEEEAKKYWTIRRESFNVLRYHTKDKRTAPFIDDFIIKPERFADFLPKLEELMRPYGLSYSIAGHVGDGNFHIIPLVSRADPRLKTIIPELAAKVNELVVRFHGSITAEHNDGLVRGPFLKQMYGGTIFGLFQEVKRIFDPDGIFNPGKKVDADLGYAMDHLRKS